MISSQTLASAALVIGGVLAIAAILAAKVSNYFECRSMFSVIYCLLH
jgi:hypothetical protein